MCRDLFIDLIEGEHNTAEVFRYPRYDYVTSIENRRGDEYNLVIIHAHGCNRDGKTFLYNYGECDKGKFDISKYKEYCLQDVAKILIELKGRYILFLFACKSYSDDLRNLLNDNCLAIIAPTVNICEDINNERTELLKERLLSNLNRNKEGGIQELVSRFNQEIEIQDAFILIK